MGSGWRVHHGGSTHTTTAWQNKIIAQTTHAGGVETLISTLSWSLNNWTLIGYTCDLSDLSVSLFVGSGGTSEEITGTLTSSPLYVSSYLPKAMVDYAETTKARIHWDQTALWAGRAIDKTAFDQVYNAGTGLPYSSWV